MQQGTVRGLEAVGGPQGQGQATVGTAKNDLAGRVRQGQAGVQGEGAGNAAAAAIGIHLQQVRQAIKRAVKGDATGRPIAAEAHLRQKGAAAVATGEEQVGTCRLGRQCIALPVGGAVPGRAQATGAAVPDDRGCRAGGQAAKKQAGTEAARADADRRAAGKAGKGHGDPRIPQIIIDNSLKWKLYFSPPSDAVRVAGVASSGRKWFKAVASASAKRWRLASVSRRRGRLASICTPATPRSAAQ